ncbi:hypothetical protein K461DRAFT_146987 [Myriangium duriaei CBS 260.36]|uniref:Uncharacterized protein n=1 Tax=Myriangium duriaei CBS 260.36 TaxID=1168546 RepID=A0A9P4J1M4_9PEZI|nr:hypothetical protein K461DRAFT_146987 [Myriangium duriaei CBS 260.36]
MTGQGSAVRYTATSHDLGSPVPHEPVTHLHAVLSVGDGLRRPFSSTDHAHSSSHGSDCGTEEQRMLGLIVAPAMAQHHSRFTLLLSSRTTTQDIGRSRGVALWRCSCVPALCCSQLNQSQAWGEHCSACARDIDRFHCILERGAAASIFHGVISQLFVSLSTDLRAVERLYLPEPPKPLSLT